MAAPEGATVGTIVIPDVSKAVQELRRSAYDVLHPTPTELPQRIKTITHLSGRAPNINAMYHAEMMWRLRSFVIKNLRAPSAEEIAEMTPTKYLEERAPSLHRRGRQEVVDIAKTDSGQPARKPSIVERIMGAKS